jgi:SAM-dependent methyltransferase
MPLEKPYVSRPSRTPAPKGQPGGRATRVADVPQPVTRRAGGNGPYSDGRLPSWSESLAHRVGPSGTVVAADIDLRFLRRHDITTSDLESKSYDFVHFRALLMHLPDPRAALARILAALKPGGWLLAEEADWGVCTVGGHPDAAWATDYLYDLFARHERAAMRHPYFGRTPPALVAEFDLERLEEDVAAPIVGEGDSGLDIIRLTVRALRSPSTTLGASEEDLDRLDSVLSSPRVVVVGVASIAVRGRKSA